MDMDELISKFIAKDSESNIQQSTIYAPSQEKTKPKQSNKQVYEYKPNQQTAEKSKQAEVSGRPSSSKQEAKKPQPRHEESRNKAVQDALKEGKMVNYNIYNNYNQYINNENYYISTEDAKN